MAAALQPTAKAVCRDVLPYLQLGDEFLDNFSQEYNRFAWPPEEQVRRTLPLGVEGAEAWDFPAAHDSSALARKAIRTFLLLRRLRTELLCSSAGGRVELPPAPLSLPQEKEPGYMEGRAMELQRVDRVVCGVVPYAADGKSQGKKTRYLVLHQYLLLLVAPDLTMPGWAIIKTICPLRAVSVADGSDVRVLSLTMRASPSPGEAAPQGPGVAALELSFEDARRCHVVRSHIEDRRREVRLTLIQQLGKFLEQM
jgi:hypothetical protein